MNDFLVAAYVVGRLYAIDPVTSSGIVHACVLDGRHVGGGQDETSRLRKGMCAMRSVRRDETAGTQPVEQWHAQWIRLGHDNATTKSILYTTMTRTPKYPKVPPCQSPP